MGEISQKIISEIRRFCPRFLKIRVLFCGLPISIGKHTIAISDFSRKKDVICLLVKEMSEICRTENIGLMCVKEFLKEETKIVENLTDYRFFRAHSIPYVNMGIRWQDFQSYLSSMRHSYRRQIICDLKKIDCLKPTIKTFSSEELNPEKPELILARPKDCNPRQFYKLYLEVMDHARTKLEVLNESFFENLFKNMNDDLELLMMIKGNEILSFALLSIQDNIMTFLLTGINYSKRNECDAYINLLHGIVQHAIQSGCHYLHLGQTSYWPKQRIGGSCIPQFIYVSARNRFVYYILKSLRSVMFPEIKIRKPRVFRESMWI